jgi:hypothetical protein
VILCVLLLSLADAPALAAEGEAKRPGCAWLLGFSHKGGAGLFDLPLAEAGCPWQLRMSVLGHGFVQYNFLLTDDRNEQMSGAVQLDATLGSYVEAWLQIGTRANRNQRPTTEMAANTQPTLALGRTALGLKLHSAWGRLGHVAVQPQVRISSGPFDFGPSFTSIDAGVDLLGSIDLSLLRTRRGLRVPLRLSARAAYLHDRSASLIAGLDCMAQGTTECLSTRLIYTTAYDVAQPRVELGAGADAHFAIGAGLQLGPTLSYTLGVVTGDGDPVLRAQLEMRMPQVPPADVTARLAQQLTFGARLLLPWPVSIDLGVQVGLSSWGYAMGPKQPQVAGYGTLSFALDFLAGGARRGDDSASRPPPSEPAPGGYLPGGAGALRGLVRDAQSKAPLADAVVRFIGVAGNALLTDEHGGFVSGPLPPGPLAVEASRGDHQTARVTAVVRPGETGSIGLELSTAARLASSILWVELRDENNAALPALATLSRAGSAGREQVIEMSSQPGGLHARLPSGSWRLRIDAAGYLSREQVVVLPAGEERRVSVRMMRRPQAPRVRLGADEILLAEPLTFTVDAARPQLLPASSRMLDEVIDLLIHHLELRQVRLEAAGQGDEAQLIAVRDYLIQGGTAPERVIAVEAPADPRPDPRPRIMLRVVR